MCIHREQQRSGEPSPRRPSIYDHENLTFHLVNEMLDNILQYIGLLLVYITKYTTGGCNIFNVAALLHNVHIIFIGYSNDVSCSVITTS